MTKAASSLHRHSRCTLVTLAAGLLWLLSGCATTPRDTHQFDPVPSVHVGTEALSPVADSSTPGHGAYTLDGTDIPIPDPLPARVVEQIEYWQYGIPHRFQLYLDRSSRYLPYVQAELKKAGLPPSLAYVALIESGFTPRINSSAGAGGMWQFMRATGRHYNLRQDAMVDERYNWKHATHAAITYLTKLHDYFDGDWALAVSAYNMGEGGLERAIAANGGERDFWKLIETPPASNRIRLETKQYYPRFLATIIIASDPEAYGFTRSAQSPEETIRVPVHGMFALEDLDKAMGYSSGTLAQLNPDLIKELTPNDYGLWVPAGDSDRFQTALRTTPKVKYHGEYKVRSGDTISQIARRFGVSQQDIMQFNRIRSPRSLQVGRVLQIPGLVEGRGGNVSVEDATPDVAAKVHASSGTTYKVRKGDTLYDIARAYGVRVADIQHWNNMGSRSAIQPGDTLSVRSGSETTTAAKPSGGWGLYSVRKGDTLYEIAQHHKMGLNTLMQWNGLTKKSVIKVGQELKVATSEPGKKLPPRPGLPRGTHTSHDLHRGQGRHREHHRRTSWSANQRPSGVERLDAAQHPESRRQT